MYARRAIDSCPPLEQIVPFPLIMGMEGQVWRHGRRKHGTQYFLARGPVTYEKRYADGYSVDVFDWSYKSNLDA